MRPETQAIHAGQTIDPATGALIPPVHFSTTYERAPDGDYPLEYVYIRNGNPNRAALERALCELEGGVAAAAFASGSVATMTLIQALQAGDHVLASDDMYYGIRQMLLEIFAAWGLETTFVDMTDPAQVEDAMRPNTKLVMIETPSNPMMKVTDIRRIADIAHNVGAHLMCDNTMATPILQQPLAHGADFVVHATTKYLGGHSDTMGGAVITREENDLWQRLVRIQKIGGAIVSPFTSWLTLRGMQTLPYRMAGHVANAKRVAAFLDTHPQVERVLYPGLETHPGHDVAKRQMSDFGGMMSVQIKGGQAEAMRVAARVKLFTRATSFGGVHSLIEHRASIEEGEITTPVNLLRLSIGLEHPDDLIEDLA
ncbi:MAG: PLP-dependent transferase, partial [Chloroflexi bacterium]